MCAAGAPPGGLLLNLQDKLNYARLCSVDPLGVYLTLYFNLLTHLSDRCTVRSINEVKFFIIQSFSHSPLSYINQSES